ncbi:right-handed parallel beta-helix repeat-containing protein, partial [bacterium]|nr:right-handed parallel beta-helix repeat-containing protein [bacterium]
MNNFKFLILFIFLSIQISQETYLVPEEFQTIQSAIEAASDGDIVYVSPGTYIENIGFIGKNISVIGEDRENTIIDGGQNGSVVTFNSGETNDAILENFTITNGFANPKGGGIYIDGANPTLQNLIISNNTAEPITNSGSGGGIYMSNTDNAILQGLTISNNLGQQGGGIFLDYSSSPIIQDCVIENNSALETGGGISSYANSNFTLEGSIIKGNTSVADGAGCFIVDSSPLITDCVFSNNSTDEKGGALYLTEESSPIIKYCLFNDNSGWDRGGAISSGTSFPEISFSTFVNNISERNGTGSAIDLRNSSTLNMHSSIMYGHTGDPINYQSNCTVDITYCNYDDYDPLWSDSAGNFSGNPQFIDLDNHDYNLLTSSPCIDTGDPNSEDPDGTRADMGAYYYNQSQDDNYTIDLNLEAEIYDDSCNKYYITPDTDIGFQQNQIQAMQISWDNDGVTCGGQCWSMEFNLELSDADGNVFWSSYNECYTSPGSGSIVIYPEISSSSTLSPNLYMHVIDVASASAKIDWIEVNNNIEEVSGCTDELACNPNSEATIDDGSCDYSCHRNGYSLDFNGQDGWVEINDSESLTMVQDFSVIVWVEPKFTENNLHYAVISKGWNGYGGACEDPTITQYHLSLSNGNNGYNLKPHYLAQNCHWSNINGSATINENVSYMISSVFSNDSYTSYVNNQIDNTVTMPYGGPTIDLPGSLRFSSYAGNEPAGTQKYHYEGRILKSVIINEVLSSEEIYEIYNTYGENLDQYDVSALYYFEKGTGDILIDHSGNQNHGAIYGGVEWIENIEEISGCTDELACNYNSDATNDDESCFYETECFDGSYECDEDDCLYVEVTSPNGGEEWFIGETYTISWLGGFHYTGIGLYKNDQDLGDIDGGVDDTGNYSWTIPSDLEPGDDYRVRIYDATALQPEPMDFSDNYFSILEFFEEVSGCTDELACNYNEEANTDDGSCEYDCHQPIDHSLSFDGENDYVDFGDVLDMNSSFTVGAWAYNNGGDGLILSKHLFNIDTNPPWGKYTGYSLGNLNGEGLKFIISNDLAGHGPGCPCGFSHKASSEPIYNEWFHVVGVFESGQYLKLYVNGVEVDNINLTDTSIDNTDAPFFIGALHSNYQYPVDQTWDGSIDDVFVVDRALDFNEVENIYNNSNYLEEVSDLAAYYNFNQGDGDFVIDNSGNQNHGTINGAEWVENTEEVSGCTDELACNPNPEATIDDGNCDYSCRDNGDYSLSFDGNDDTVHVDHIDFSIDNFAVKIIFNSNEYSGSNTQTLFRQDQCESGTNVYIGLEDDGLNFGLTTPNYDGTGFNYDELGIAIDFSILEENDGWNELLCTYDGDTKNVFLNGILMGNSTGVVGSGNIGLVSDCSEGKITIGSNEAGSYFDGSIDNISISNNFDFSSFIADYKFNNGEGGTLYDHSGNQNHGTINGAQWQLNEEEISGCTDELACNYGEESDCEYDSCYNFAGFAGFNENYEVAVGPTFDCEYSNSLSDYTNISSPEEACSVSFGIGNESDWKVSECGSLGQWIMYECEVKDFITNQFYLGNATETSVDVLYWSAYDIGGFQFSIDGTNIEGVSGGAATDAGFTISNSSSTVLGFSLTGATIPAGEGVLTTLSISAYNSPTDVCINDLVVSDAIGTSSLDFAQGCLPLPCEDLDEDGICDFADTCVDNGSSNLDEISGEDCNGDCNGTAEIDDCGICADGNTGLELNADIDCNGDCFGEAYWD